MSAERSTLTSMDVIDEMSSSADAVGVQSMKHTEIRAVGSIRRSRAKATRFMRGKDDPVHKKKKWRGMMGEATGTEFTSYVTDGR